MTPPAKLRILIAEDEPLARERIRRLLHPDDDFEIVAETGDGTEAVALTRRHCPDILLLDVQLPGLDGFGVLAALGEHAPTAVIILTAHRRHAVRAFDAGAVDYLLKPISRERLRNALLRARALSESPAKSLRELGSPRGSFPARIAVRRGASSVVIPVGEILCAESAGTRCRITTKHEVFTANESLSGLQQRLPDPRFARISRFAIVNLSEVAALQPKSNGDQQLCLSNGAKLVLSRTRRTEVISLLKRSH